MAAVLCSNHANPNPYLLTFSALATKLRSPKPHISSSFTYAHRKCVHHWSNEKGDITCDICNQSVIEAGLIAPLVNLLQNAEFDIKKEPAWEISNATSVGTHEQIKYLVSQGCIKPLCDLLVCHDPRIVAVCLEGPENILKVGEAEKSLGNTGDINLYAQMIDVFSLTFM